MRRLVGAVVVAVLLLSASAVAGADNAQFTVLDTLGTAAPTTTFSVWAAGGTGVGWDGTKVGPEFVLTEPTVITEIGAFVNNCSPSGSPPFCPGAAPFLVQIVPRSTEGGLPDVTHVLGTYVPSNDNNPVIYSYESVNPNLTLAPGTYFALIAAQNDDTGAVLAQAQDPGYVAGSVQMGWWRASDGVSNVETYPMAVRILGVLALPTNKDQCKNGGWQTFSGQFKNQGDCVSFVATSGKNLPAG
jgi:hypothetical protein